MSNDELIQKCGDTICENLEPEQIVQFRSEMIAAHTETAIVSVVIEGDSEHGAPIATSYMHGDLEDQLIMAGLVFGDITESIRADGEG
jgi:hypothetical protein